MSVISSFVDLTPSGEAGGARDIPPPSSSVWVQVFSRCQQLRAQQIGGKGLGLARMTARGLPVPAGYCITAEALAYYLRANDIALSEFWGQSDPEGAQALADRIRGGLFPRELQQQIEQAWQQLGVAEVAVRSSAIDEDSAEHSFAGQHLTVLHVRGTSALLAAVRDCWASLLQASALAYRAARGAHGTPQMAVVVQSMIAADVAGVAFAINPLTGAADEYLIEACLGLGEGLVAGRVASDSFVLDAASLQIRRRHVQFKPSAMVWDEAQQSVVERPVDAPRREAAALSDAQLLAIARLLQQVSTEFGGAQDVEWAIAGGQLHLLQSRPITTIIKPAAPPSTPFQAPTEQALDEGTLWSRMDIGEIFTGRMTPLGISFAKHYQYKVHRDCGTGIGLLDLGDPDHYMGYLKGHVYLNVAYTAYLLAQSPPGFDQAPFLQRFSSEEVDIAGYVNPYGSTHRHPRYSKLRTSAFWAWATIKEFAVAKSRARRMVASRHAEYDHALKTPLHELDLNRLRQEMTHALDYFKAMHVGYLPFYINAFALYGLLEELCKAWMKADGLHLQNRLKGDMSNLRTVQSARDLWALAQALQRYPQAEALVRRLPASEAAAALAADPQGQVFCSTHLAGFMRENGVRGHQEMELSHPRWVDDPTYVFQMLKTFLERGYEVENRLAGPGHAQPQPDSEALLARLSWPKRLLMRRVISMYSACSRLREESRMAMITSIWLVRRVLCEAARRLVAQGVLRDESELAYLQFDDLLNWLNGYGSGEQIFSRAKVEASRRMAQSWQVDEEPPLTFIGHAKPSKAALISHTGAPLVQGLGTSAGRVRARARVIHDLASQAGELQKGEIIVTHFTDASWTPLFALAGGIVTDIGSMLSHSSIVAREFGIPSVVNTKHATARIRTGDQLLIDGETGAVLIETAQDA
ncbi:PEP/pyruvate-binding domain-containing protein [Paucibacter sp. APW11]|uniref:PEP/pyruvate-binding domain-containing protein n=1 Tax=Roseateles aquae TaxID=3077235 RepID=A0ABU3P574_9BURK|nr:PEP/pyruvate-binding domain-containing protein [Paucibacter sp. APW11]MDT8997728.1 PEP/pyruvate-binding domain-containing protein [Paucibacter sp. APW11]